MTLPNRTKANNPLPNTAEYKGKKSWRFSVTSDFIRNAEGANGERLSPSARTLYLIIQSYVGPTSPVPFPRISTIATYMNAGEETVRRYMKELIEGGWLRVEHRRRGWNQFDSNAYMLLDGKCPETPSTEKPVSADTTSAVRGPVDPSAAGNNSKSTQEEEGARCKSTQISRSEKRSTSSNTVPPSASGAGDAAEDAPSEQSGAAAPEPPRPGPLAERFIKSFRYWSAKNKGNGTFIPREREALVEFFKENPRMTPRELTAIMLAAWLMTPLQKDGQGLEPFWYCLNKSRRISSFLNYLPNIQDELNWQSEDEHVEKIYRVAEKRFIPQEGKPA